MIPRECKRIAEVDFPIAEVSKQAVREKSSPLTGHPLRLHQWWARRPLASCRAILMGLLLPDPCDPLCPNSFREDARGILLNMENHPSSWLKTIKSDIGLRKIILDFIADYANWNSVTDHKIRDEYLSVSRALISAAYCDQAPLIVDPFSGGGAIPIEGLRLGGRVFSSDLNPVACLILKVMLEDIQHYGHDLVQDLRKVTELIKRKSVSNLSELFPDDSDGANPITYMWVRSVRCESPNCGAEIPLMRSFWLCKKKNRKIALRYTISRTEGLPPKIEFDIFEPKVDDDVPSATVTRAKATCICCGTVLPPERVREQFIMQNGGADVIFDDDGLRVGGARITAVVLLRKGHKGRFYRLPTEADYVVVRKSQQYLNKIIDDWEIGGRQGLCPVPDEPTPLGGGSGAGRAFSIRRYGMMRWGDLFTARQKVALIEIIKCLDTIKTTDTHRRLIALLLGKMADNNNSLVHWSSVAENPGHLFTRQAIPMVWDFCESTPKRGAGGVFLAGLDSTCKIIENLRFDASGRVENVDSTYHPLQDRSTDIWFTDPPYYDAVPYADLADFFLVWFKRILPNHHELNDLMNSDKLSPKQQEIVQDETKTDQTHLKKDQKWFEIKMGEAFTEGRRILKDDGIGSVIFAHKTTEGWEALLSGMIEGGWTITGSWPIATEHKQRFRARESAALATSIHLICRPRMKDAPIGDWAYVLRELPKRVRSWMIRLQDEGIRGADLVFACIGPALEIFSRYCRVETAEGNEVKLSDYLEKVWEVVGRTALARVLNTAITPNNIGASIVVEEDARLTALFLWTLQSTDGQKDDSNLNDEFDKHIIKGFALPYDVVRRFAQPMGIDLDEWRGKIITQQKGIVRLMPVMDRSKELFGEDGASQVAEWIEIDVSDTNQASLFPEMIPESTPSKSRTSKSFIGKDFEFESEDATVLDRVHAAMLFQAGGQSGALRTLIASELSRGPEFLHLANALSALYPIGSQEKRLLDAMLLAVPR
ncbi:MAG: DUF1156 domain-containing protein [Bacteroidetes bacterium]|nr:DUF1156 domain-containing protein [Bacteroidota bacterium]